MFKVQFRASNEAYHELVLIRVFKSPREVLSDRGWGVGKHHKQALVCYVPLAILIDFSRPKDDLLPELNAIIAI